MDTLIDGAEDIHAVFGVPPDASAAQVNRRYRQLALQYHPDKNPLAEAKTKFQYYSQVYKILTDASLLKQYQDLRATVSAGTSAAAADRIRRFKEQLRQQELAAQQAKAAVPPNHSALEAKGLKLRRELQQSMAGGAGYVSYRSLAQLEYTDHFLVGGNSVAVTWRLRPEPEAQIDAAKLAAIMALFGDVEDVSMGTSDGRYATATVTFTDSAGCQAAVSHNYRNSADIWDGTPVRKLASLLRLVTKSEQQS